MWGLVCGLALSRQCWAADPASVPVEEHDTSAAALVHLTIESAPATRLVAILLTRLQAELNVGGFAVALDVDSSSAPPKANAAYAEVEVAEREGRVLLDVTSRSQSASSHVKLTGSEKEIGPIALQAVEFLRAGLVPRVAAPRAGSSAPLHESVSAPPGPVSAPDAVGRAYLDLGCGLLTNLGPNDKLALLSTAVGYAGAERLAIGVMGDIPLNSTTLTAPRGSADYRLWLGSLSADYSFWRSRRGELAFGTTLGVARTVANGHPDPPGQAAQPKLWSLTLGVRLRAELKLHPLIAIQAETRVLSMSPSPVVAVFDEERRLGAPSVLFGLGARVGGW
ncbi:MAG TPA: hypothetical protein VHB79_39725 [Polyangiaceae bacterium]|nr:hypothetical protein [Polyangiaceae bacterium]